ncbi:MAG: hypothetical protein M3Z20_20895 [Chloroflexota bacterium]|nr:hypothetical protein [Chloroflexota bacterium]
MDAHHFASLIRDVTAPVSRRALARSLAGLGLAGPLIVWLGLPVTSARKRKKKRKRKNKKPCKHGATTCDKACVDTRSNAAHCGGCNQPCGAGIVCFNGACQDTTICTPACAPGRECFAGACSCLANGECEGREDPAGEWCVNNPPGRPDVGLCGCLEGFKVCAAGERCSNCCSDLECQHANPGNAGIICPTVPANTYLPRFCCVANEAACGNDDQCCSRHCDLSGGFPGACTCREAGEACSQNEGCCSGACSPTERTCT